MAQMMTSSIDQRKFDDVIQMIRNGNVPSTFECSRYSTSEAVTL
jgi:hypothetical protein